MAADLKSLLLLEVIVFILVCGALSHSQDNYNDALRNNRGEWLV